MASISGTQIRKVIVACDAGMGSNVMLASQLRKQLGGKGVAVEHTSVHAIPGDADVVVVHKGLADRARVRAEQGDRARSGVHRRPRGRLAGGRNSERNRPP